MRYGQTNGTDPTYVHVELSKKQRQRNVAHQGTQPTRLSLSSQRPPLCAPLLLAFGRKGADLTPEPVEDGGEQMS